MFTPFRSYSCGLCVAMLVATCATPISKVVLAESACEAALREALAVRGDSTVPPGSAKSDKPDRAPDETPTSVVSAVPSDAWDRATRDGWRPVAAAHSLCWFTPLVVPDPACRPDRVRVVRIVSPREAGTFPIVSHAPPVHV